MCHGVNTKESSTIWVMDGQKGLDRGDQLEGRGSGWAAEPSLSGVSRRPEPLEAPCGGARPEGTGFVRPCRPTRLATANW